MADPKGTDAKDSASEDSAIDTRLIRKLAGILTSTGLSEIEVEQGGLRIRVGRQITQSVNAPMAVAPSAPAFPVAATQPVTAAPAEAAAAQVKGDPVKSPMVGTAYLRPQPGAAPFIKVGDKVSEGQTLMIVEAMKTMNPIPAPRAGTVVQIIAGDGEPVEFGETLIILE